MHAIYYVHMLFGERVLPIVIILMAIWLTAFWKPGIDRTLLARAFPVLVMIQFTLGLIYWIHGLIIGRTDYIGFPFILHPLLGLFAVVASIMAIKPRPGSPLSRMGRWAPLAVLALLLIIALGSIVTGRAV